MKRIMYVLPALVVGGAEKIIVEYALNLNKEKFEVIIVTTSHSVNSVNEETLRTKGVKVIFIGDLVKTYNRKNVINKIRTRINRYNIFKKIVKQEKPDVIHSHLAVNDFLSLINAKKYNIKLIHSLHSEVSITFKNKNRFHEWGTRYCINKYNMALIALHKRMKEEADNLFNTNNSLVLNNPVDINHFSHPQKQGEIIKNELKIPESSFVVGHVGSFKTPKNHNFLIRVFKNVKKIEENSVLLLIGTGELEYQIKNKVKELGLEKSVYFLGLRNDVAELMSIMDVIVFPSLYEGFPVTLLEAQAAGINIIAADTITKEVKQTNLLTFLSLEETAETWAQYALSPAPTRKIDLGLYNYNLEKIIYELETLYSL